MKYVCAGNGWYAYAREIDEVSVSISVKRSNESIIVSVYVIDMVSGVGREYNGEINANRGSFKRWKKRTMKLIDRTEQRIKLKRYDKDAPKYMASDDVRPYVYNDNMCSTRCKYYVSDTTGYCRLFSVDLAYRYGESMHCRAGECISRYGARGQ